VCFKRKENGTSVVLISLWFLSSLECVWTELFTTY
jgi:hypothetical protein